LPSFPNSAALVFELGKDRNIYGVVQETTFELRQQKKMKKNGKKKRV
jgi:hypothetical protein